MGIKTRLKNFWYRLSGLVVCLVALLLPYRPRLLFAKMLNFIANPPQKTLPLALGRPLRFWNKLIFGVLFFLGLPLAKLFLQISGKKRLAPPPTSASYWVAREDPAKLKQDIQEPF